MKKRLIDPHWHRKFPLQLALSSVLMFAGELIPSQTLHAQTSTNNPVSKTIKGRVSDEKGAALQGVTVSVKGSAVGAMTNERGVYELKVSAGKSITLVFSFIGMEQKEVVVGDKTEINVSMSAQDVTQQEVVVVGYGTQKRQAVTGAVVTADLKTYQNVPVNNIMETLKGTVAGLNVGEANKAGAVAGFTIRGQNTIAASQTPLIVLDGAIFQGSMADISPNDIESVTVLKDASAAAVYGSQSANGVILIQTKSGASGANGKPRFSFNASYGVVNSLKPLQVYDAKGYLQRVYDIERDLGVNIPSVDSAYTYLQPLEKQNYLATPDHRATISNPYSLFSQTGYNQNYSLGVSQKTDRISYYLSGNYTNQRGVVLNDYFKHYSIRANVESKVTSWLTVGLKAYYSYRDNPQNTIYGANANTSPYSFSPYATLKDSTGAYLMYPQQTTSFINPFLMLASEMYDRYSNLNGIFTGTVRIPWVKGLTYTLNYSQTLNTEEYGSFYGFNTYQGQGAVKGKGSRGYARNNTALTDHIVKYNRTFAGLHNVDVTLLNSVQKTNWYGEALSAQGFDNDQLGTYHLQAGTTQSLSTSGSSTESIGQMARATYTYDNKYSVTGTVRHDGYTAFSANHKWGNFSSLGLNWNITREGFMKNVTSVNNLALRMSYGTVGNQSIAKYSTLSAMGNGYYNYVGDPSYTPTEAVNALGNNNLKWESTTGWNGGIDFSILHSRLSGSIDGYVTRTNNLAFTLNVPLISGFPSITANAGEIRNHGIELNLRSINVQSGKFTWASDASFSLNRNKVTHLLGNKNPDGSEANIIAGATNSLFIGQSLGSIYDYQITGMWQVADSAKGTIMKGYRPGEYAMVDRNNDGKISSDSDRAVIGRTVANFRWSFTNTFTYGDWSLLVYLNSIWGGNGYFMNGGNTPYTYGYANTPSINVPVYDYWTPSNPNAIFPRLSYKNISPVVASKYFDRSFIRLQKVAIGYNATRFVKKYGIGGLNLALSADNLATYAPHWVGLDAATGAGNTVSSIPSLRTFTFNVNINF